MKKLFLILLLLVIIIYFGGNRPVAVNNEPSFNEKYLKLNITELIYLIVQNQVENYGELFCLSGFVMKIPELETRNEFCITRRLLNCCSIDTVPVFFRLRGNKDFPHGSYAEISGRLARNPLPEDFQGEFTETFREYAIEIDSITVKPEPADSFIYNTGTAPPFYF